MKRSKKELTKKAKKLAQKFYDDAQALFDDDGMDYDLSKSEVFDNLMMMQIYAEDVANLTPAFLKGATTMGHSSATPLVDGLFTDGTIWQAAGSDCIEGRASDGNNPPGACTGRATREKR